MLGQFANVIDPLLPGWEELKRDFLETFELVQDIVNKTFKHETESPLVLFRLPEELQRRIVPYDDEKKTYRAQLETLERLEGLDRFREGARHHATFKLVSPRHHEVDNLEGSGGPSCTPRRSMA